MDVLIVDLKPRLHSQSKAGILSAIACSGEVPIHVSSLVNRLMHDRHPLPKIAAQPVPDAGRRGCFWMHHARHRQIHAMGAAIVERVRYAVRKESAGS